MPVGLHSQLRHHRIRQALSKGEVAGVAVTGADADSQVGTVTLGEAVFIVVVSGLPAIFVPLCIFRLKRSVHEGGYRK